MHDLESAGVREPGVIFIASETAVLNVQANLQPVNDTQVRLTQEQQADRAAQLQRTMALLVHASACNQTNCVSSNCAKVKALFQHAVTCLRKVSGGCHLCRSAPTDEMDFCLGAKQTT